MRFTQLDHWRGRGTEVAACHRCDAGPRRLLMILPGVPGLESSVDQYDVVNDDTAAIICSSDISVCIQSLAP